MIQKFVDHYMTNKEELREMFAKEHPANYKSIVHAVTKILVGAAEYGSPDPARIVEIDHGDYQGTLVYIIGASGYQPSKYWSVFVSYGSCSGCDTLQGISEYSNAAPTEEQIDDYMILALHIVQGIRLLDNKSAY